jgi:hypothetical protein
MRKFLWIIAVLFVAMGASIARADVSYDFTGAGYFAGTDFTYISIGGHIQGNHFYTPTTATDVLTPYADLGALNSFELNGDILYLSTSCCLDHVEFSSIPFDPGPGTYTTAGGDGMLRITDLSTVVTPEPGTVVLYLTGIGLVGFVMRKRIAQGLPQAT